MEKKLYRSRRDRWLGGVCGGLAQYFRLDSLVIRLLAILAFCLCWFGALIAYIVMVVVVPLENADVEVIYPPKR